MESITERIKEFLNIGSGYGCGSGSGDGSGYGSGYGCGSGSGYGDGSGYGSGCGSGSGYGYGDGSGYGSGCGDGSGYGSGCGSGSGSGSGSGYGYGYGCGVKKVNNHDIYIVDDTPTIITALFNNYAKGYIVGNDLTLKPCYIAKNGDIFAHGKTLREAVTALQDKLFEDMPEEERIAAFIECHDYDGVYSNSDLYDWHHKLTGSCEMGRQQFAKDHGIDLDGKMSIKEFIKLTKNAYGGEIIKKLEKEYQKGEDE